MRVITSHTDVDIYKSSISPPNIPYTINSPCLHLFLSCLSHASPCILVHIFLCLHAHPMLDATHHIHLATFLLKAFERALFFFFRERKAELLLHRLVAAIVERRKRQKLKRKNRALDLMKFQFPATWRYVTDVWFHQHTLDCVCLCCVCWCIPSESKFFTSRFFFAFTESDFKAERERKVKKCKVFFWTLIENWHSVQIGISPKEFFLLSECQFEGSQEIFRLKSSRHSKQLTKNLKNWTMKKSTTTSYTD